MHALVKHLFLEMVAQILVVLSFMTLIPFVLFCIFLGLLNMMSRSGVASAKGFMNIVAFWSGLLDILCEPHGHN